MSYAPRWEQITWGLFDFISITVLAHALCRLFGVSARWAAGIGASAGLLFAWLCARVEI